MVGKFQSCSHWNSKGEPNPGCTRILRENPTLIALGFQGRIHPVCVGVPSKKHTPFAISKEKLNHVHTRMLSMNLLLYRKPKDEIVELDMYLILLS